MANHHDAFFKGALGRPEEARSILASVLPPALLGQLQLDALERVDANYPDPTGLTQRFGDLLFKAPLTGGETAFVFVLWEHQSTVDPLMPLRVLIYMGRIWDDWLRQEEARRRQGDRGPITKVPAILPVVLHQGPGRWEAATELLDLIELPADALAGVRTHLPSFRFVLDDLAAQTDEAVRRRQPEALGTLALLLMRHAREDKAAFLRFLAEVADLFRALEAQDDKVLAFSYILEVVEVTPEEVTSNLGRIDPRTKEAVMTAAEKLRDEGRREGRREGEEFGLLEGERRVVLRLLRKKFGTLPASAEQRIAGASLADLEAWTDRVLTASTLNDVFKADA